jgi:hypothetical protein
MKLLLVAGCALACLLSGCGTTSGSSAQLTDTLKAIASDPNCGHVDRIQGDIGGLGSGLHVFLERTCPAVPPAVPPEIPKP